MRLTEPEVMDPESGFRKPAILLSSVDFPAPLRPTQATICLARILKSISNRTLASPYATFRPLTARISSLRNAAPLSGTMLIPIRGGIDLPIASAYLGIAQTFLVSAVRDDPALVHDGESVHEVFHM